MIGLNREEDQRRGSGEQRTDDATHTDHMYPAPGGATLMAHGMPARQGLYDPRNEHDSCGIGFVANISGEKTHKIIRQGLQILVNLTHRGAVGADPDMGDGAGILIQIPHDFFAAKCSEIGIELPGAGDYGIGLVFLPQDGDVRDACQNLLDSNIAAEGQVLLGWRGVPVNMDILGPSVQATTPVIRQVFVGRGDATTDQDAFERKLFVIRQRTSHGIAKLGDPAGQFYVPSFSSRTVLYKGMLLAKDAGPFYTDLGDERLVSALALVHQRFSTNTFPSWDLAQPFRMICHNGEINTVRGNINWMNARRQSMSSELLGDDLEKLWPLLPEGQSDSASFDNALELLVRGGYSMAHAVMLLIPEAWQGNTLMDPVRRAMYEYNAALTEPWDGPAAIAFTDGRQIGATLDRNGLRPARYVVTDDGVVVLSSEAGVLPVDEDRIVQKWRLQPGKMLLIDTEQGRIIDDAELKAGMAAAHPYQELLDRTQVQVEDLPDTPAAKTAATAALLDRQQAFGYSQEDLKFLMTPMAENGAEATGSMGNDTPIAVMSDRPKLLYNYFRQNFAQVTNPAIDPIRESLVMSLMSLVGPRPNLLGLAVDDSHPRLEVHQPILSDGDLAKIRAIGSVADNPFGAADLDMTYPADHGAEGMKPALDALCAAAQSAIEAGDNVLILSDRAMDQGRIAIPALLATGAVHHHLIRAGLRTSAGLVVETGEAREIHQFCVLGGYGAEAINPYLAFETLADMVATGALGEDLTEAQARANYVKAAGKGILKVMSKMGISTYLSYCGAQIFDAVGLRSDFVDRYFFGTGSAIEGAGLGEIAIETVTRHAQAFGDMPIYRDALDTGGDYQYRERGERHYWAPQTIGKLQHAVRGNALDDYRAYAKAVNDQTEQMMSPRGLFELKPAAEPIPLAEVEPAKEIVKRFATGAMSFGSISREMHTTLAVAMNRIGGRSNTGEGGEETDRFTPEANGDSMRSSIKQVASGRFGVTTEYLVNSDMMQIKIAQGAKPGEGGQLPGYKVDPTIAKVRHSTPGVGLISPPPHHDIYSIEDLAQLIFDLKNVNPEGKVSVKLVSEIGVGTVAAGVAKARADHVTIAGTSGGTGASPQTSIKHAGSPWEIGLAETHQTLVLNKLRGRIAVQVDGGFRTGRDVIMGALLGADEFGFSTAPLVASGCIMMRKCHLNTCPVGIATQDKVLRKRFTGTPEAVINFMFFVAEEARELMAEMGFRTFEELIGRSDRMDMRRGITHFKAKGLDLSRLLKTPQPDPGVAISNTESQVHLISDILDRTLIAEAAPALESGTPVRIESVIKNTDRTTGAMLSGRIASKHGHAGLPDDTIHVALTGTAGQSFGAWAVRGVTLELKGETNDYAGKGLSGGRLIVYPNPASKIVPDQSMIVGNVVLYGAIAGECYFRGVAAERFAVRNSGAYAVVEGVGDHGCEYMTGGVVVVIGGTGRNFAAGMSGGIAYVLDEDGTFESKHNPEMVELERITETRSAGEIRATAGQTNGLAAVMEDMLGQDTARLHTLLTHHARYTNSAKAENILANWAAMVPKFVKVVPVDYRRALTELRQPQAEAARAAGT